MKKITKDMIRRGIALGVIEFIIDPNMENGTVAKCGDYWFYFGGLTAEQMGPDEYRTNVPFEDIVREIYDVLTDFETEMPDEHEYYRLHLEEQLAERHWAEIKCDYIDETDMFWRIDAWKTCSGTEEGKVIAYIDDLTGRVLYIDPIARVDKYVAELVAEKRKEIAERTHEDANDLWNILGRHFGHEVEIAVYGGIDDPANIALEDVTTGEVILDAELYNIHPRVMPE